MTIEYKVCTKCGESKPATTEFFPRIGWTGRMRNECKVCTNTYNKDRYKRQPAYVRWRGMVDRCYNVKNASYSNYGGMGITVCKDWKDYDTFLKWHNENSIVGWELDKDILGGTSYSPEYCVFVPNTINMFFTFTKPPSIRRRGGQRSVNPNIKGRSQHLGADTEEDVLEQFYLFKELYLEKLVWEMKEEHKKLCSKYPNTPEISPKLLAVLENFSTKEYLEMKNGSLLN